MIINDTKLNELFSGKFELVKHEFNDGKFNMDFDFERTQLCAEDKALPMLRFYGWNPWTVSLGYNQKEDEIDKLKLTEKGFGLVRRPTGGRAVLHADELTYSVVLTLPKHLSVHDVYREIHIILLKGLKKLAAKGLEFEKVQPDFRQLYDKQKEMSVSCFASTARYEIALNGKKVVGSAQRLFGNTLLQHGSILLGSGHEQLAEITKVQSEEKREILRNYILNHSATLEEACDRKISFEECRNSIISIIEN
ncbi:biotin/lipoate A/B protein ligase family protein [Bacteroidota bacterium]